MRRHALCALTLTVTLGLLLPANAAAQRGGRGATVALPEGEGSEIVRTSCGSCHGLNVVTNGGFTRDEWHALIITMVKLPKDQHDRVVAYLAANLPDKDKLRPVIVPGTARVDFQEWALPTLGSRPHDPLWTPDGAVWYTGMFSDVMGRVDVKTGQIREYPLKTKGSGAHGLDADKAGNIWFTANSKGYVGKLDPKTGGITEYPTGTRDPHTPIVDQKGTVWFTSQGANTVGRLDPKTGELKVVPMPIAGSRPYGIVISSTGAPWLVEFGANRVASLDPVTMAITEYTLPHAATRPRRIAIDNEDVIWYTDYSRGFLGRFNPKTGKMDEWASPSGPRSQPYAISYSKGAVWYFETGTHPDALVRFDPKTEKFQSWPVPGTGGVVRHMMTTHDGNLVIAESGRNMVGLVTIF